MSRLRLGVIGAGGIADRRTIPGILMSGLGQLAAVMNPTEASAGRLGAKYGVPCFTDAEALARDPGVDAVYIASPLAFHLQQALAVCAAGKPLLLEKPLGLTCEEGRKIISAFEEARLPLAAGLMMRFGTHVRQMKQRLAAGEIGSLVSAYARFSCWYPEMPGAWRQRPETGGGGALLDMGIHVIDLLAYISGSPIIEVAAMNANQVFAYPVEDASCALLKLGNGALCSLQSHFNIPDEAADWRLDFFGTHGCLLGEGVLGQTDGGALSLVAIKETGGYDSAQGGARAARSRPAAEFGNLYTRQIDSFCRSVLGNTPLEAPAVAALRAQEVVEAAYRAGKGGGTESLVPG